MKFESLQEEIGEWHRRTFTPDNINRRLASKLVEEAAEFQSAIEVNHSATEEAADCLIVLMAWAARYEIDLLAAVRTKFDIVKNRNQAAREKAKGNL